MKKIYLLMLFLGFLSFDAFAQDDQEASSNESGFSDNSPFASGRAPRCRSCNKRHYSGCTPTPPPQQNVPIDGGLSILLVAGAAYGVKRKLKKRKMSL